ncbi:MAG: hypothetical protein KDK99_17925, partial [Verrucomicrobiales bacterium]|nr:hypothetical protein [Verrucomicrobiales bacterium]
LCYLTRLFADDHEGRLPEDMAALRKWGTEAEAIYAAGFDKLRMFRSQSEGTPESWIFLGGGRTINRLPGNVLFVSPRPLGGSWLVAYGDGSCEGLSDSKIEGLRMLIRRNGAQP